MRNGKEPRINDADICVNGSPSVRAAEIKPENGCLFGIRSVKKEDKPFFLTKGIIGVSMAAAVMIVIMLPFFMFAMFERHGQPLEVLLKHYIEARFIRPRTRVYETENFYGTVERNIRNKREVNRILHGKDKRKNQTDTG